MLLLYSNLPGMSFQVLANHSTGISETGVDPNPSYLISPWISLLPFFKSVYTLVSATFCGNEYHNLIMACVKKYFRLFAMNLLLDNFIQFSLAFWCDKEYIRCLCKVLGVSSLTRAGTVLALQVPLLYLSVSWEVCWEGCKAIFSPQSLCWNIQIRIVIIFLVMQHGHLCTKNCPEPVNSFQEWAVENELPALLIWIEI